MAQPTEGIQMEKHDAVLDSDGRCMVSSISAITGGREICGQGAIGDWHFRYPVVGSGAEPMTARFTDEAETHGVEFEHSGELIEATPSDQNDEVGMFPDGTVVGDEPLPGIGDMMGRWQNSGVGGHEPVVGALSAESMAVAFGVDWDAVTRSIASEVLRKASERVENYMRHSFSTATIGGVVETIMGQLEPWPNQPSAEDPPLVRRSEMPKEWVVISEVDEVVGPMTEAAAHGLVTKLKKDEWGGKAQRLINPEDL